MLLTYLRYEFFLYFLFQKSDLLKVKRNMYNAKRKQLPKLPTSRKEVSLALQGMHLKTIQGEEFLLINDEESDIIVYSCLTNLKALSTATALYIDGTFQYCPKFYFQLLTILGLLNGHYVPLVFCLLPSKEQATYTLCFEALCDICTCHGLVLQPRRVVTDLEVGLQNACKTAWPCASVLACRFHLCQAWWRKIQKLHLVKDYSSDSEIGKCLKLFFGLPFLRASDVENCYKEYLAQSFKEYPKIRHFCKYMFSTYISDGAKYPPATWASPDSTLTLTTNACESFHSHLNENFNCSHPNIFEFNQFLVSFQKEVFIMLNSVVEERRTKNNHTRLKQAFLESQISKYVGSEISSFEMIRRVSHYYASSVNL